MTDTAGHHAIVVGIDGSQSAIAATRWAAREAVRRHVPLRLLHTCYIPPINPRSPISLPRGYGEALAEYGHDWLREAQIAATQAAPGLPVGSDVRSGNPAAELISASRSARLLVLGSRGLGGFSSLLIGSVAVAVAANAACPVVVVRGDEAVIELSGPVVVGVDGSATSDSALEFAFDAADSRDVDLIAVHAWTYATIETGWPAVPMSVSDEQIAEREELLLSERLAGWSAKYPDVRVERRVRRGRPARTLLKECDWAQLVVVGSRGRSALAGLGLGSVSQAVLHHSPCPVAVVRPD